MESVGLSSELRFKDIPSELRSANVATIVKTLDHRSVFGTIRIIGVVIEFIDISRLLLLIQK